jgi:osmoprotectant transport system permease protein
VVIGLFLYSLMPVVHNTCVGLSEVDPAIKEVAFGMGMTRFYRLVHVELPIASPLIFAGIRIATVTSVGTAVFAYFVGGGGLGNVIYQGIRVQNMGLILSGTLALMLMAVLFDSIMGFIEKRMRRRFSPV